MQNTGRPCVGLKGTVVSLPHAEQVVIVSPRSRGMPPVFGHQRGAEAVRRTVEGCRRRGIASLTLFAFSSENWKRPPDEIGELMNLLRFYLRREIKQLAKNGVRIRFSGEHEVIAPDIVAGVGRTFWDDTGMHMLPLETQIRFAESVA